MAEFRKKVGQLTIRAHCQEPLAASADWLLDVVASFGCQDKGLVDGVIVQVGWSLLRLRQDGNELIVCEPNFDANPFQEFRDDVSSTLMVLARQNLVHERLGVKRSAIRYDDKVVFKKGCLSEEHVYAQRQEPRDRDSGWYIGPLDSPSGPPDADELEACYVYQLLRARPSILDVVALSTGYLVVFDGARIDAVLDPDNQNIWRVDK